MRLLVFVLAAISCSAQPILVNGITNAADYTGRISPGSIATLFGSNFTTSPAVGATSIPLSTSLNDVTVFINNLPCPLFYVSATQINFQVPSEAQVGAASLDVTSGVSNVSGLQIAVVAAAPGIFQYGTNRAVAVDYPDPLNAETAPVAAGGTLVVYLTGIGPVTDPPLDGNPPDALSSATSSFSASIGGVDAPVAFLGLAPGFVGLAQANINVPATLANGDYPLTITVNDALSVSSIVTVSGTGTPPPGILTYLTTAGTTIPPLQNTTYGYSTVVMNGTNAYVCGADQITVIDVSNPQAPVTSGAFGTGNLNGQGTTCTISQDYLVEIVSASQFLVFDLLTSATNPPLVSGPIGLQVSSSGSIVFDGTTAAFDTTALSWSESSGQILSESGAVETYNFVNFTTPAYGATFTPPAGYTDNTSPRFGMADLGNGYVAVTGTTNNEVTGGGADTSGNGEVTVINVSDPANPVGASEFILQGNAVIPVVAHDLALQGTEALITGNTQAWNNPVVYVGSNAEVLNRGDLTLSLVDFTNPQAPTLLTTSYSDTGIQSSSVCRTVSLGGGFFAIAIAPPATDFAGASTLAVVDTRDHDTYTLVVYPFATVNGLSTMAVSGNYLYVVTAQGLNIYQITLPG